MSQSMTRLYPIVAEQGCGCWISDVDGNLFLDFTAGIAVNATGCLHPQCEHWGIVPDIICVAKGVASGLPLGAIIAKAGVMDWPASKH